jgi:hypothetical protein
MLENLVMVSIYANLLLVNITTSPTIVGHGSTQSHFGQC